MNLVSIIIPTYNSLSFLEESLFSAINQTYLAKEIIVIDDGSNDGTSEYFSSLKIKNLFYYKIENKGACHARNFGFNKSKGKYIQFLDADDVLSPGKISEQVQILDENPDYIAVCRTFHFNGDINDGTNSDINFLFSTEFPHEFLLNLYGGNGVETNMISPNAWLTPRNLIQNAGPWNENLIKDQDGEFFCRVVMASRGVLFEPNGINYYRRLNNGRNISSGNSKEHFKSQLIALTSKKEQLSTFSNDSAYKNAFAIQYKLIAIDSYPKYKDISKKALQLSQRISKTEYLPILGGKSIEFIKKYFGWKMAKLISHFIHTNFIFKCFLYLRSKIRS